MTRCRAGSSAAALLGGRPGALLGVLSEVARFREDVPAQLSAAARFSCWAAPALPAGLEWGYFARESLQVLNFLVLLPRRDARLCRRAALWRSARDPCTVVACCASRHEMMEIRREP